MQSVEQEPIYLPDVENSPQPSRFLNVDKVTIGLPSITEADVKGIRSPGWHVSTHKGYDPQLGGRHLGSRGGSSE
jgi:hypothetical protein